MSTPAPYQSAQIARQLLQEYPILVNKISKACDVDESQAEAIFAEALKFLWLIGSLNQKLSPSLIVDYAWHEFILFTRLYHGFCNEHFGRYIHHSPGGDEKENNRNFRRTIQLYILHFGEPPERYWGHIAAENWRDSQCGSCSN